MEGPSGPRGVQGAWRVSSHLLGALGQHSGPPVFQELIREGCLHKLSRKGLQQRMFFLVGRPAQTVPADLPGRACSRGGSSW